MRPRLLRHLRSQTGQATAEYALVMVAAAARQASALAPWSTSPMAANGSDVSSNVKTTIASPKLPVLP